MKIAKSNISDDLPVELGALKVRGEGGYCKRLLLWKDIPQSPTTGMVAIDSEIPPLFGEGEGCQ